MAFIHKGYVITMPLRIPQWPRPRSSRSFLETHQSVKTATSAVTNNVRMFRLTTVSAKTGEVKKKPNVRTVSRTAVSRGAEVKGPFTAQITKLRKQVEDYTTRVANLRQTIERLNGAVTTLSYRKALYKEFDQDLRAAALRLSSRFENLNAAEEVVKSFRQDTQFTAVDPNSQISEKQRLLVDNKKMIETALAQERCILLHKMKLRLYHDHRDLSHLRRVLNKMEGGGGDYREDEEITENLKAAIGRLRDGIEAERERIRIATLPDTDEYDAAVIIQKNVRGFLYRISHEPIVRPTPRTEHQEEEEGHPHEEEEEGKKEALGDAPAAAAEPEQTE